MQLIIRIDGSGVQLFGPLEAEIMDYFWSHGDQKTIKDVCEALTAGSRYRVYNTIMTTVHRLAEKGLLKRQRGRGRATPDQFSPAVNREDLQRYILTSLERAAA